MIKSNRALLVILACVTSFLTVALAAPQLMEENDGKGRPRSLSKVTARIDEAIGVMTKGQLCNLTMNYGQITDTRLEDPGNNPSDDFFNFRYPKTKPYGSMVDDFALLFAVEKNSKNGNNGNVIDGYTNNGNEDWIAKDGSLGKTHYDGSGDYAMLVYVDGTTPYLAHSDLPQTWPLDKSGAAFWPGYFRRDPVTGMVYEDEFVSDRDVYAVFTDGNNQQGDVIGIEIEQMAYCYGRTYAEDFQFYEFFLHNTSGDTIKEAWFGIYQDPDCSDYSQETIIIPQGHGFDDPYPIIMQRDFDGDINAATSPNNVGRLEDMDFGMIVLETPHNLGVTDFHYYTDTGPTFDHELWPIISSQPDDPDIANIKAEYFHGANPRLDDVSNIIAQDWVFIVATGPFDFAPDDTLKYTIAVVVGDTDADFIKNSEMAIQMFEKGFVGPAAPPGPTLSGVPGDERVTLYWDNTPEKKPDPLTGELDFEGYKIYRSEDNGATWGAEITDSQGNVVGYVPIAQFDLDNQTQGVDPVDPNNYLGDNTGLRYVFVDSSVYNGIEYFYTVTAYDCGDPEAGIPSYETAKGVGTAEKHFVSVTPRPEALAYVAPEVYSLSQISGKGKGDITIEIVDGQQYADYVEEHGYSASPLFKILFDGFPATTFSVFDSTGENQLLKDGLAINADVLPVVDEIGIRLTIGSEQKIGGIKSVTDEVGTDVFGAGKVDFTESWYVSATELGNASLDTRSNSYEIRFTADSSMAYSRGREPVALMRVPFEVWRIHPDTAEIICEYDDRNLNKTFEANESIYLANVPYPVTEPQVGDSIAVNFPADFPLQVIFQKAPADSLHPEGGHLPVAGQRVIISYYSSYSDGTGFAPGSASASGDVFLFSIKEAAVQEERVDDLLSEVRVVPNPYVVTSLFDPRENVHSLKFMYLPEKCDISIYSLAGVKVKEIEHNNGTGIENWDLTNEFGQDISFGVYVYVVSTPRGGKTVGKIAIIK